MNNFVRFAREFKNTFAGMGNAIKPGIDRQVLPHRKAPRQVGIRTLEIHARENGLCRAPKILAQKRNGSRRRSDQPKQHRNGGRFARAIAAKQRRE